MPNNQVKLTPGGAVYLSVMFSAGDRNMEFEVAKKVVDTLEEVNKSIFSLLSYLEGRCEKEEFKKLKREISRVSNGIDRNLYPLIINQYPELNPLKEHD